MVSREHTLINTVQAEVRAAVISPQHEPVSSCLRKGCHYFSVCCVCSIHSVSGHACSPLWWRLQLGKIWATVHLHPPLKAYCAVAVASPTTFPLMLSVEPHPATETGSYLCRATLVGKRAGGLASGQFRGAVVHLTRALAGELQRSGTIEGLGTKTTWIGCGSF